MFRSSPASRSLLRGLTKVHNARLSYSAASSSLRSTAAGLQRVNSQRPRAVLSIARPTTSSLLYATKSTSSSAEDILNQKLAADPKIVSLESSVRHVFEGGKEQNQETDGEMLAGVRADWATIKETFSMADVPKDTLYLGMAGLIPYAATSFSTVVLAYDINYAHLTGAGRFFTPETAHQLLDLITPVQIGFGAVVGSFQNATEFDRR